MAEGKQEFIKSLIPTLSFLLFIWLIKLFEYLFNFSTVEYGLFPRTIKGVLGIFTFPLIHANFNHLASNTLPLLFLGTGISYFYKTASKKVFVLNYFIPGILLWFFARPSYHIGASGLIYGLVTFLFFSGVIRRDTRSIALALLVTFLYGGLVWGVLPIESGISWEGHLFGAFTGIFTAIIFRKSDPYKRYKWEDEPDDTSPSKLEISYDNNYPFEE